MVYQHAIRGLWAERSERLPKIGDGFHRSDIPDKLGDEPISRPAQHNSRNAFSHLNADALNQFCRGRKIRHERGGDAKHVG